MLCNTSTRGALECILLLTAISWSAETRCGPTGGGAHDARPHLLIFASSTVVFKKHALLLRLYHPCRFLASELICLQATVVTACARTHQWATHGIGRHSKLTQARQAASNAAAQLASTLMPSGKVRQPVRRIKHSCLRETRGPRSQKTVQQDRRGELWKRQVHRGSIVSSCAAWPGCNIRNTWLSSHVDQQACNNPLGHELYAFVTPKRRR